MLPARWRLPVIAVALTFGTTGGFATSISHALAAGKGKTPLVTDVPARSRHGLAAPEGYASLPSATIVGIVGARGDIW